MPALKVGISMVAGLSTPTSNETLTSYNDVVFRILSV